MKVFISYAHVDRARMLVIAEAVRAAGHDVQADEGFLDVGDDFARKIEATIGACDACIVLWSEASCRKPWVPAEANFALSHKKRVLSIKIEACSPPLPFSTFHMLDLTASSDLGPLLRSLDPAHVAPPPPKKSPWPMRLLGAAVGVAVLSVGAWLAVPALREEKVPPAPPPEVADAGAPPVSPPLVTPATATAPDAGPAKKGPPADPCVSLKARFEKMQADCRDPCDLDHYPMREDLDRCRACEALKTQLQSCKR